MQGCYYFDLKADIFYMQSALTRKSVFKMPWKRGKQSEEETQQSSEVVKLTTICKNNALAQRINKVVVEINKITSEAYRLINFHVLWSIEGG